MTIEDGEALSTRFIAKLVFRNGMSSTHRMPFEVAVPVHAKFNRDEATNHWTMPSRTLRQLMDHFGPGVELLDISSNGEHVKFTCFTEKTLNNDGESAWCLISLTELTICRGPQKAAPHIHRRRG